MTATYEKIATTTVSGSSTTAVNFTSFSGYTDLILQVNDQVSSPSGIKIRFNSDTGSNYSMTTLQGNGSSASSFRTTNATSIYNNLINGDSTTSNNFTPHIIQIQNYSNTTTNKTLLWRFGNSIQAGGSGDLAAIVGLYRSTSAITSIEVSVWNAVNFIAGSTFTLYGIKAE
jgi:hypothetical protein